MIPLGGWFVALAIGAGAAFPQGASERRFEAARFELRGPLELVVFGASSPLETRGETRIVANLRRGEVRSVIVPFDGRPVGGPPVVAAVVPPRGVSTDLPDGRVEFIRFVDPDPIEAAWRRLPAGLRARSRPPIEAPVGALRQLDLLWILACSGLVFGMRRRPILALGLGLIGAAGGVGLRRFSPSPPAPGVSVIEADLLAGAAVRVDGAAGSLGVAADDGPFRVSTQPRGARMNWTLELSDGGGASWVCDLDGSVCVVRPFAGDPNLGLSGNGNHWAGFDEVWTRSAAGGWAAHGPWSMGEQLPSALAGNAMPPGWLASGLPPGRGVLIGRLGTAALAGADLLPLGPAAPVWLRASGFE